MKGVKFLALAAAALTVGVSTPSFAKVEFIVNGSFETNKGAGQFNYDTSAKGWTVTSAYGDGYAFLFKNSSAFTTGSPGQYGNVALYGNKKQDGTDAGSSFFGVNSTYHPSTLSQTISGLVKGDRYTLTFDWAAGQQQGYSGDTSDYWEVTFGSQTKDTSTVIVPSKGFSGWMSNSMTFIAMGKRETLSFTDIGTCLDQGATCGPAASGGPPFSLLDGVSMTGTAAPEPSTWAMLGLGFGGLGYAAFRRGRTGVKIA